MTSTETHIMALHNGQRVPTLSRMVQVLWFRADLDLGGRLFRQAGKKGRSLLDLYVYLLASSHTQQGAKRAKRYLDFLRHYAPESWRELGIFGPALEIELNSILRVITLEAIEAELDQETRPFLRAYLLRSKAFNLTRRTGPEHHRGDLREVEFSEIRELFEEARNLFAPYSKFELGRTHIYQARRDPTIDVALKFAKAGMELMETCSARHYIQMAKDELVRRNDQLLIRSNHTHTLERFLEPIESARTLDELWPAVRAAFQSRLTGKRVPFLSISKQIGGGKMELVAAAGYKDRGFEIEGVSTRKHELGFGYRAMVPDEAHYYLIEQILNPVREVLRRIHQPGEARVLREIGRQDKLLIYAPRLVPVADTLHEIIYDEQHDVRIWITGETGTGKEFYSKFIHANSPLTFSNRKGMEILDCTMLNANADLNIARQELFGVIKGSHSTATETRTGLVEAAQESTLLIDEAGELPPSYQAAFLRLLEEQSFAQLGGAKRQKANVRIILATNRDIPHMVSQGLFRQDLFMRRDYHLHLPPLREIPEQIPVIVENLV
ncbi:MAG: sigma-54 factor interaction domain-containing protein, partial [Blastocatellia bacterium]|nr:sigma-54 factor interaction domain-containing protein [Blastocatellia bacterium]